MNSNKKLYMLVAALAVLLIITVGLIFALRPGTDAGPTSPAPTEQVTQPTVEPQADPTAEPEAEDPLAGLSEEEMGALAMAEENHAEDVDNPEVGAAD